MAMDIRGYTQMNVDLERVRAVKPALTGIAIALYFFWIYQDFLDSMNNDRTIRH
jgi:hypothetical protein